MKIRTLIEGGLAVTGIVGGVLGVKACVMAKPKKSKTIC